MTHTGDHVEEEKTSQNFSDLNISSDLKKGIKELGYVTPTAFQLGIFEDFRRGNNVVGEGESNYGKSLAFSLPILSKIATEDRHLQALIICESSLQGDLVAKEYRALGRYLNIAVANSLDSLGADGESAQILVLSADEFSKASVSIFHKTHTIFLDSLSAESVSKVLAQLANFPVFDKQFLIFGKDTMRAIEANASELLKDAVHISNNDQPKITLPAKHITHQPKEAEPKPRALLAALELHKPKLALVTCNEASECELLARFLSRYGYRIRVVSEEFDRLDMGDALNEGLRGSYDVIICQNTLLVGHDLEHIEFMINYDMFDRAQTYEQTTQFSKQAPGLQRIIVNLLTNREIGYLGPIKAQCLIDFSDMPLPSEDEVLSLCAKRIIGVLNREAGNIELGQFELLAQKIFSDENALPALSLLLRNHLLQMNNRPKVDKENKDSRERHSNRPTLDRRRPERRERMPREREQRERNRDPDHREAASEEQPKERSMPTPDGVTRLYITLGKRDGFLDLASLAQYLSEQSGVDLGHFSGSGMVRDHSAHVEVDEDVALDVINALHESTRPNAQSTNDSSEAPSLVVCEKARASTGPRPYRRPQQQRRRPHFQRRS